MTRPSFAFIDTPIGWMKISATPAAVTGLEFLEKAPDGQESGRPPDVLALAMEELKGYFSGKIREFTLPFHPGGTLFQQKVLAAVGKIPFGMTRSYGQIAREIHAPKAARAVGGANAANPIPIFIPCHRVIGKNGRLTGYGGGLWRKKWLLAHEGLALAE